MNYDQSLNAKKGCCTHVVKKCCIPLYFLWLMVEIQNSLNQIDLYMIRNQNTNILCCVTIGSGMLSGLYYHICGLERL